MFGLSPWLLLGSLIAMIAVGAGGYFKGHSDAKADCVIQIAKLQADAAEKAQAEKDAETAKANASSATLETKNEAAKVVFRNITRTVDRVVEKPIYRDICLDADGLQLANAALAGVATTVPASKQLAVPMRNADASQ